MITGMDRLARLLVAIDGSPQANAGAALALRLAAAPYATAIRFVHVVDGDLLVAQCASGGLISSGAAEVLDAVRESGRACVSAALEAARAAGVEADGEMREGAPVDELLDAARSWHATCIVTGTHGRAGLARTLLGSRTETLLRHGDIPVLTVRAGGSSAAPRTGAPRILCAVDGSPRARAAFEAARAIARTRAGELVLLTVVSTVQDDAAAQARLDALAAEADGVAVRTELIHAPSAGIAIPAQAGEMGADLIVLGTHGRDGIARAMLGSVAETVLRRSAVPVLAISPAACAAETRLAGTPPAELASPGT
jgi:nucleotide-binding universal stress UspA family protein